MFPINKANAFECRCETGGWNVNERNLLFTIMFLANDVIIIISRVVNLINPALVIDVGSTLYHAGKTNGNYVLVFVFQKIRNILVIKF